MSRCVKCNRRTDESFEGRAACVCGSVCWYQGPRPEWPPIGAVAFLYGLSIPQMTWTAGAPVVERQGRTKLTWDEVDVIRRLIKGGQVQTEIAKRYGVSPAQISRIHLRQNWRG